jgi:RND family efflux transporter MFP subunit
MKTLRFLLVPATLAAMIALAGCGGGKSADSRSVESKSASAKPDPAPAAAATTPQPGDALLAPSDVALARRADLAAGVPVSGTLTPGLQARVTSPFDDLLEEVVAREGQRVGKGEVLARFRPSAFQADAASARAQLKSAQADHERMQNLLKEGAVSERDVESAEAAWRAAQSADAVASRRLADAVVRAPIGGTIATRSVQTGDRVGSGDPLFVVADTRELEFEATVPSEFVALLRPGAPVRLTVTGANGDIDGHVARINTTADPATRQVKVYVRVPNPGGRLVGGLFASGQVLTRQARSALAVPSEAIRTTDGRTWAFVIEHGRLARRDVRTGVRDETHDLVEVLQGLSAGDTVVTGTLAGLGEGQAVRVTGREI